MYFLNPRKPYENRFAILVVLIILSLSACGLPGSGGYHEFSNAANDYKFSVKGSWTPEIDINTDSVVLYNPDGTLSLVIQRFGKNVINSKDINDFVGAYKASALRDLLALSELKYTEAVDPIDGFIVSDAEYYETVTEAAPQALEAKTSGTSISAVSPVPVIKACIIYLESETAFYACVMTGRDASFGSNIASMLKAITTIKETPAPNK